MNAKAVITVVVVGLLLIVAFQNMSDITLRVLFWEVKSPQLVLMPLVFLAGLAIGVLLGRSGRKKDEVQTENSAGKGVGDPET